MSVLLDHGSLSLRHRPPGRAPVPGRHGRLFADETPVAQHEARRARRPARSRTSCGGIAGKREVRRGRRRGTNARADRQRATAPPRAECAAVTLAAPASSSSVRVVGGARKNSPRAARSSTSAGGPRSSSVVSCSSWRPTCPGGSSSRKKRASKRRDSASGVTHRAQGTSAPSARRRPRRCERARERGGLRTWSRRALAPQRPRHRHRPALRREARTGRIPALLQRLPAGRDRERPGRRRLAAKLEPARVRRGGRGRPRVVAVGRVELAAREDHRAAEEARPCVAEDAEHLEPGSGIADHDDRGGVTGADGLSIRIETQQSRRSFFHVIKLSSNRPPGEPSRFLEAYGNFQIASPTEPVEPVEDGECMGKGSGTEETRLGKELARSAAHIVSARNQGGSSLTAEIRVPTLLRLFGEGVSSILRPGRSAQGRSRALAIPRTGGNAPRFARPGAQLQHRSEGRPT